MKRLIALLIVTALLVTGHVAHADAGPEPELIEGLDSTFDNPTIITGYVYTPSSIRVRGTSPSVWVDVELYLLDGTYIDEFVATSSGQFDITIPIPTTIQFFSAWGSPVDNWDPPLYGYDSFAFSTVHTPDPVPPGGWVYGDLNMATNTPAPATATPIPPTNPPVPSATPILGGTSGSGIGGSGGGGLFDPSPMMAQLLTTAASIFNGLAPIFLIVGGVVLGLMALQQIVTALRRL